MPLLLAPCYAMIFYADIVDCHFDDADWLSLSPPPFTRHAGAHICSRHFFDLLSLFRLFAYVDIISPLRDASLL